LYLPLSGRLILDVENKQQNRAIVAKPVLFSHSQAHTHLAAKKIIAVVLNACQNRDSKI